MSKIYNILISKILNEIIPASRISILKGNKIFGAAILKKKIYQLVVIGTNNEVVNPLYHGEISTIYEYFNLGLNKKIIPLNVFFYQHMNLVLYVYQLLLGQVLTIFIIFFHIKKQKINLIFLMILIF